MEKDKILKILEKVPLETKLYSTTFGQLKYNGTNYYTDGNQKISLITKNDVNIIYLPNGKYKEGGEVTLYPSKDMRNWDKFAWKEGDVLVNNEGDCCIFAGFLGGYPYVTFSAKLVLCNETVKSNAFVEETKRWEKTDKTTEKYIEYINTKLKGSNHIVNPKTLEVEIWKFNDGDILTCPSMPLLNINGSTFILKERGTYGYLYHAALNDYEELYISTGNTWCGRNKIVRYATEEEKTKLFNALAKEGKRWNAEKKVIEDIKPVTKRPKPTRKKISDMPEHEFEPFEKVLVRDQKTDKWTPDLYGSKGKIGRYNYTCIGGLCVYCIPYEGNEHLLGTTNNPD